MANSDGFGDCVQGAESKIGCILDLVALKVVPLVVALVSLLAAIFWTDFYPASNQSALSFQVVEQPVDGDAWGPEQARSALAGKTTVTAKETKLSEAWFWVVIQPSGGATRDIVEFQSRHTRSVQCWDAQAREIGNGTRDHWNGAIMPALAGFALVGAPGDVVCRVTHIGPAQIVLGARTRTEFEVAQRRYERHAGLLEGGLILLALMGGVAAIINRQQIFLLMAVWIFLNMRLAALSFGSDIHWLGYSIPQEMLPRLRMLTIAMTGATTWLLFNKLFAQDLKKYQGTLPWKLLEYPLFLLALCAMVLPYRYFLPVLWGTIAIVVPITLVMLFRIVTRRGNSEPIAVWYAAALSVVMIAGFYEVIAASLGFRVFIDSINNTISAIASSVLMGVAVSLHARSQRLALSRRLIMAREDQTRAIARDMHDSLGGTLSMLRLKLTKLITDASKCEDKNNLTHLLGLTDDAIKTTRDVTHALHPLALDSLGLAATIRWYAERFTEATGITCEVEFEEVAMPREHQHAIFRAVQEVLTNVAKHSHASYVSIKGILRRKRLTVEIEDNGCGGAVKSKTYKGSLGLSSITERLDVLGGAISLSSPVGGGTHVLLFVPL